MHISPELEQDPAHTAKTTLMKAVGIPQSAISVSRAFRANNISDSSSSVDLSASKGKKKSKHSASGSKLELMETGVSDEEELADIMFLFSETEDLSSKGKSKSDKAVML